MGSARTASPRQPQPFGTGLMEMLTTDALVQALGVPHRSRAAFWRLVSLEQRAVPAVIQGLGDADPGVRRACCEVLDLFWDDELAAAITPLLDDPDPDVQWMAAHALSCERCRGDSWAKRAPLPGV